MACLEHAYEHAVRDRATDLAQVVISIDHMAELLLKAALVERGESIFVGRGKTLAFPEALKKVGSPHAAEIEIIHEQRNTIQHFFAYGNAAEAAELFDTGFRFAEELLSRELALQLSDETDLQPLAGSAVAESSLFVELSDASQRDVSAHADLVVWADAREGDFRVRLRVGDQDPEWLTPSNSFEYMSVTDGKYVACYRQSGGIVLYDLASKSRTLLTETGGPSDVANGFVAAQGIGIEGGLGGGIFLVPVDGSEPEKISSGGDSPKLWGDRIFWQETRGQTRDILARLIAGGPTHVIVTDGVSPSVRDGLIAWTDQTSRPSVHVMDLESGEKRTISRRGIIPVTDMRLVALLEHLDPDDYQGPALRYDLVLYDWTTDSETLRINEVGFPQGGGGAFGDQFLYWEARAQSATQLLKLRIP